MVWIDAKTHASRLRFRWKFSALGRRIVAAMLVVTILLSIGASIVQAWITAPAGRLDLVELWQGARPQFAPNLLRHLIVGMSMLVIFDRLAARHLKGIAAQVRSAHWMDEISPILLERDAGIFPNEIDSIVDALEAMRRQAQDAYSSLAQQADEMAALNASLWDANRDQAELTYALSHNLIAPVNTLEMLLNEIAEVSQSMSDTSRETLCDMQSTTRRMRQQIEAVQSYALLLQDRPNMSCVNLNQVLRCVLKHLEPEIMRADARIDVSDALGDVYGHDASLKELFIQLVRNAVRYRDPDRALTILIHGLPPEVVGQVRFAISDSGLGIDEKHHEAVFGLFRRLHTQSDVPGNGMGLPISRRIVHLHGGTLELDSRIKQGTRITISIPGRTG